MSKLEIKYIKLEQIKPYEKNPRKNDDAVKYVKQSIKEFGFKVPIVVDKDNVIVCGHTRWKASKELGLEEVPCVYADDLSEEQIKAYRLADNKVSEFAEWDDSLLNLELDSLDIDMTDFGFLDDVFEEEQKEIIEDEVSEDVEPLCKLGDIWQLGNHRLMCGDSTNENDVEKLTGGVQIDLVFTDPPYGMKKQKDGVLNDNLNYDDLLEFNKKWIPITFKQLKDNGSWYCWGIDEPLMDIYSNILKPLIKQNKITFRNLLTWDKGIGQGQLSELHRKYAVADEKCLFVACGVQGFNNNADNYFEGFEPIRKYLFDEWRKISDKNNWDELLGNKMGKHYFTKSQWALPTKENYEKLQKLGREYGAFKREYDEIKREYDEIKREFYLTRNYFDNTHDNMNNVWHFKRAGEDERTDHATPKPIALCSRAVKTSTSEGQNVLDVFGGSGSTLIACEQLNRKCLMMELDPHYCDVIINRWETLTGDKAVLIESN